MPFNAEVDTSGIPPDVLAKLEAMVKDLPYPACLTDDETKEKLKRYKLHDTRDTAKLFVALQLEKYTDAFNDEGYDDPAILKSMPKEHFDEACEDCKMLPGHKHKLQFWRDGLIKVVAPTEYAGVRKCTGEVIFSRDGVTSDPDQPPLLVCMYGTPNNKETGRKQLEPLTVGARAFGYDALVLDHSVVMEDKYASWEEYVARLVEMVNQARGGRTCVIFAHSYSNVSAYAVAQALGPDCEKLYACGGRPPHIVPATIDEVWGVSSKEAYEKLTFNEQGAKGAQAWGGKKDHNGTLVINTLGAHADKSPANMTRIGEMAVACYCPPALEPKTSAETAKLWGVSGKDAPKLTAEVLALAGGAERPKGETPGKMARWAELTSGGFTMHTFDGVEHCELVDPDPRTKAIGPAFQLVLADLKKRAADAGAFKGGKVHATSAPTGGAAPSKPAPVVPASPAARPGSALPATPVQPAMIAGKVAELERSVEKMAVSVEKQGQELAEQKAMLKKVASAVNVQ